MIKFGFTLFVLMALASGIPYLLLHKVGGAARTVVAYAMGSVATSATSAGIFLATMRSCPRRSLVRIRSSGRARFARLSARRSA